MGRQKQHEQDQDIGGGGGEGHRGVGALAPTFGRGKNRALAPEELVYGQAGAQNG